MTTPKSSDPLTRLIVDDAGDSASRVVHARSSGAVRGHGAHVHDSVRDETGPLNDDVAVDGETEATGGERASAAVEAMRGGAGEIDANAHGAVLEELTPAIEAARVFAERWDEGYRKDIFRVALERLIGPSIGTRIFAAGRRDRFGTADVSRTTAGAPARSGATATAGGRLGAYQKLARALNLDSDSVERLVEIGEDGKLHILVRMDGKAKKDLQTKYSLAYLYVKEVGLGERMVGVEELRSLCVEHACYDVANFTGNFGKDVRAGLIRQQGEKGVRNRKFLLSKKGLDEAATLLGELANQ